MDLTWTQVKNVTGYCISRSTQSGSGFQEVARVSPATKTSWKDTGLTPGVTYYYKIRTYTKSGSDIKYGKYSPVAVRLLPEISVRQASVARSPLSRQ